MRCLIFVLRLHRMSASTPVCCHGDMTAVAWRAYIESLRKAHKCETTSN